ncbi:MAG: tyrosine-type recombinase/integrase [Lachnospiraceae bacterium]|jgi:integrase|nr:tyrosine-type recombinase/integrase [Lachnospiraceae bacterium]GFI19181.1 transposase from transposon Tn916 [Lachnospiraceae bacterium]
MAKRSLAAGFRQRKDGRYESRFTVNGKRYSVYADTLKECKAKDAELRERIKAGSYVSNRNITLDQYYEEWKAARQGTIKGNTALNIECRYRKHISPAMGSRKMVDIEKREIVRLQKELAQKVKATTVNITIVQLKSIFNDAVVDGIITKSPAAGVKALKVEGMSATETYHRALTLEEQNLFMENVKQEWLYELIALLLCTGMRLGEATALTWSDIDYINNVIHVTKTISRSATGEYITDTPKSKTSIRDIPLNDSIKRVLKSQKEKLSLVHGNVIPLSQAVFEGVYGGMVHNSSANKAIRDTLKRINAEEEKIEHFSAHALRDTFATRYIEQGGSAQVLKTILGHASLSMTMDLYSHVLPNTKQEEMNSINIAL